VAAATPEFAPAMDAGCPPKRAHPIIYQPDLLLQFSASGD
jgi:hypothetical protein